MQGVRTYGTGCKTFLHQYGVVLSESFLGEEAMKVISFFSSFSKDRNEGLRIYARTQ